MRRNSKPEGIKLPDGRTVARTGIYERTVSDPADRPPAPDKIDRAMMRKLLAAKRNHPHDPDAASAAYVDSLTIAERKRSDEATNRSLDALKAIESQPATYLSHIREQCRKLLERYGVVCRGGLPSWTWADGTKSVKPDPADLSIPDQVRDAADVLADLHGMEPGLDVLRAFSAGQAYERLRVRPFEPAAKSGRKQKLGSDHGAAKLRQRTEEQGIRFREAYKNELANKVSHTAAVERAGKAVKLGRSASFQYAKSLGIRSKHSRRK
jgi:hypothetical protein